MSINKQNLSYRTSTNQVQTLKAGYQRAVIAAPALRQRQLSNISTPFIAGVLVVVTFVFRVIHVDRSFDLFYDELIYHRIAQNVAEGQGVTYYGSPFYLHPPLFFYIEGFYLWLLQPVGTIIQQVYATRYFNAGIASLSTGLLYLTGQRAAGWRAGVIAAVVFALEPFLIRISSRNLLETMAMFWVLLGYVVLLSLARPKDLDNSMQNMVRVFRRNAQLSYMEVAQRTEIPVRTLAEIEHARRPLENYDAARLARIFGVDAKQLYFTPTAQNKRGYIVGIGCAFGAAVLTKDTMVFLTLLPLGICWLLNWSIPRRVAVQISLFVTAIYALYPLNAVLFGNWAEFEKQKFRGLLRFTGVVQESGFNQQGGPSFIEAILRNLSQFATTYILLALGLIAIAVLLWWRGPINRLLAVWAGSAYTLKGFLVIIGTNEEQYFYYLVVPAIVVTVVAGVMLIKRLRRSPLALRWTYSLIGGAGAVFLGWTSFLWVEQRFTPDNGYEHLLAYMQQNIPPGSVIATTTNTSQEMLKGLNYDSVTDYDFDSWGTVEEVQTNDAQYAIVSTRLIEARYDAATPEFYEWLRRNGKLEFAFTGPTNGQLYLYRLPNQKRTQ